MVRQFYLKQTYALDTIQKEIKMDLRWKLTPGWVAFIILETSKKASGEEKLVNAISHLTTLCLRMAKRKARCIQPL